MRAGLFSNLDTTKAQEQQDEEEGEADVDGVEQAEFNMDDFLKQGGVNLDEVSDNDDAKTVNTHAAAAATSTPIEEKKVPEFNTDPDERMSGWLSKSSVKMPGSNSDGGDLLGMFVSGIGSGLKMGLKTFTDTIKITK